MSRTLVVRFCGTPCVTVPFVVPSARVRLIDFGGHVEKYPAEDPEPAIDALMAVVPGALAVIWLAFVLMVATVALPTEKLKKPIDDVQLGIEANVCPGGTGQARLGDPEVVTEDGAHIRYCWPFELKQA